MLIRFNKYMQPCLDADDGTVIAGDIGETATETADLSTETNTDTGESDTQSSEVPAEPKPKQSDDENAKYAAARREAEQEKKSLEAKFKREKELIKNYGAANGCYSDEDVAEMYGSQGINTLEDLAKEVDRQEYIKKTGIDPAEIDKRVEEKLNNHPLYKEYTEKQKEANIKLAIEDLHTEFPELKDSIKTGDDLGKLPNAEKIVSYMGKGNTLSEAYWLANRTDILTNRQAATKQAVINNVNSKGHLAPTGQGVEMNHIEIPAETMKLYKSAFPTWTEKQIREHYSKS